MRGRSHAQEEESEGYFASISDLMVGILFIFLLMLTIFALNFADEDKDEQIRRLRAELDRTTVQLRRTADERDVAQARLAKLDVELAQLRAEVERMIAREARRDAALAALSAQVDSIAEDIDTARERLRRLREGLLRQLRDNLAERGVAVEISAQQDVLRLPSEEIFVLGSAAFTARGRERVTAVLEEMSRLLPCYAALRPDAAAECMVAAPIFETVLIEGHTDAIPSDNWRLSTDRARAVLDLIQRQHTPLLALRNPSGQPLLGLAGYGESRTLPEIPPVDARNRRIELRFLLAPAPEQEVEKVRASLKNLRERMEALLGQ